MRPLGEVVLLRRLLLGHALVDGGDLDLGLLLQLLQFIPFFHHLNLLLQKQDLLVGLSRLIDQLGLGEVHIRDVLSNHGSRHQSSYILRPVAVTPSAADRANPRVTANAPLRVLANCLQLRSEVILDFLIQFALQIQI